MTLHGAHELATGQEAGSVSATTAAFAVHIGKKRFPARETR